MTPELPTPVPTEQPEALKYFVEGSGQFHEYLGSGSSNKLELASQMFQAAVDSDPGFDLAVFYHALTKTELRDPKTAITELQSLIEKGVAFLPEAYLHLAYAHAKKYTDNDFYKAEEALDRAMAEAKRTEEKNLKPIIETYRVFLYAVMGGRLKEADIQKKEKYIDKAIKLGRKLLLEWLLRRDQQSMSLTKLELHNALGIAYMRKGAASKQFPKRQSKYWNLASKHFRAALDLRLNPVRVHQNMGTFLRVQGRQYRENEGQEDRNKANEFYQKAVHEYEVSIAINSLDPFPHYALARLYARLAQWDLAQKYLDSGRQQSGAVSGEKWASVAKAIEERDSSLLAAGDD